MNFFEQLASQPDVDITIRIMKKNDRLTLNVMPGSGNSVTQPILVSGTGPELDQEFFSSVFPGVSEVAGMVSNIEEVKTEAAKKLEDKKTSESLKASDKVIDKKHAAKKKADAKSGSKKKTTPQPVEASIFDNEEQKDEQLPDEQETVEVEEDGEDGEAEEQN